MSLLFIKGKEKIESASLWVAGIVLLGLAMAMIPCIIASGVYGEPLHVFSIPFLIYASVGGLFLFTFKMGYVRPANVLVMMAVIWLVSIGGGMLPFCLGGMPWYDALMESASGYTTAGCSTITDFSVWSNGILLYRSLSNWVGGIMIILILMIIMPMAGVGNRSIVSNEMYGSESSTVSIKLRDAAIQFSFIYIFLTAVMFILLIITGTKPFDALSLSLCTVSTGGLISGDMVISFAAKIFMIIFMFLGATNFYLHYKAIFQRKPGVYLRNKEFIWLCVWCFLLSLVMYAIVHSYSEVGVFETYIDSLFAVISAATTAGYVIPDMDPWPSISLVVMLFIAFVGASSGSTSGGVKISRMIIVVKYIKNSLEGIIHPNNVQEVYVDGSPVSRDSVRGASVIITMFIASIFLFTIIFMLCGVDAFSSVKVVIAMITSFGTVDVDVTLMTPFLKVMMVVLMWIGRLEVLIALAIFSPRLWKEHMSDVKHKLRRSRA